MLKNFRSYQLAVELYRSCEGIPAPLALKDQLQRATLSITLNLSEGGAKPTAKDRRRFHAIAFASLRETQTLLTLLNRRQELAQADKLGAHLYKLVQNAA